MAMIKCTCLTQTMIDGHGETCFLDLEVARKLERTKQVQIIGAQNGESIEAKIQKIDDAQYLTAKSFKGIQGKTIRVAWVQDYHKDGGAELSNFIVTRTGTMLGFEIAGVTPANLNEDILKNCDVVVLNNCFEFSDQQFNRILKFVYDGTKPVIKYEHDHREINLRKPIGERIFKATKLNIFISPGQMENHVKVFGDEIIPKSICLPLAIDTDFFKVLSNEQRKKGAVLVPSFAKCRDNTYDYIIKHPEYTYTILGSGDFPNNPNVICIPDTTISEMPGVYNRHELVLHLPQKVGGGERVIFEAVLCGCKVITNENALHTTWKNQWDWEDKPMLEFKLRMAPFLFWKEVEKCL
jgi:hypothetical protein